MECFAIVSLDSVITAQDAARMTIKLARSNLLMVLLDGYYLLVTDVESPFIKTTTTTTTLVTTSNEITSSISIISTTVPTDMDDPRERASTAGLCV